MEDQGVTEALYDRVLVLVVAFCKMMGLDDNPESRDRIVKEVAKHLDDEVDNGVLDV